MADELLLSIEKLIYGGEGLAHADGNTVFVPYVLPGEQVRAAVRTRKKKLIHTSLVKVEQTVAARIAAPCPHFQVCGGCDYQHIEISEQVRLKKEIPGTGRLRSIPRSLTGTGTGRSGLTGRRCRGRLDIFRRRARGLCRLISVRCFRRRCMRRFRYCRRWRGRILCRPGCWR